MPTPLLLYLFNEASSGTAPTAVHDTSAGTAADATITYGASGAWASVGAGDGLNCAGTGGAVTASLAGTKVQTTLTGTFTVTVELVLDAAANASSYGEYLSIYDGSGNPVADVTINHSQGGLIFSLANDAGVIKAVLPTSGVVVLHVVVDTTQATATNRILVYVAGSPVTPSVVTQVPQNTAVDAGVNWTTSGGAKLGLGEFLGGSFAGGIVYYAAVYAAALTSGQVSANAAALASNNDANPNGSTPAQASPFFGGIGAGP